MKILVVDDDKAINSLLSQLIKLEGFQVISAETGKDGLEVFEKEGDIDVIFLDVRLPDFSGLDLVQKFKLINPVCEIIVLTAYGTIEDGVKAIKHGAYDYITKGDEDNKIIPLLHKAVEKTKLTRKLKKYEETTSAKYSFDNIIGSSEKLAEAINLSKKVSLSDTNVLLLGETGTGKEVFAQSIHYNSNRKSKSFVAVNCAAFAKDLLESEMFGYKAGAFTGAVKNKKGLFEEADGGTLFLDEIAEMDINLQAKLLRVLETNSFIKAGDTKETKVDVRVISATNKNLIQLVEDGKFRNDLYYRISVFTIVIPALRERIEDIKELSDYFIGMFNIKLGRTIESISPNFYKALQEYNYPGNIRELKNIIERVVLLNDTGIIDETSLPFEFQNERTEPNTSLLMDDIEKAHILRVYNQTEQNRVKTAELLGIGLTTLYRKLQSYGIE